MTSDLPENILGLLGQGVKAFDPIVTIFKISLWDFFHYFQNFLLKLVEPFFYWKLSKSFFKFLVLFTLFVLIELDSFYQVVYVESGFINSVKQIFVIIHFGPSDNIGTFLLPCKLLFQWVQLLEQRLNSLL